MHQCTLGDIEFLFSYDTTYNKNNKQKHVCVYVDNTILEVFRRNNGYVIFSGGVMT